MSSAIMETWLFDSLLVTTLLMGAILMVRRPVAKLFGPGVAYALWLIPAARLLMPSLEGDAVPAGESGLGVNDVVRESILAGVSSPDTVVDAASKGVVAAVDLAALGVTFWLGGAALFFIIQMIRYASMRDDLLSPPIRSQVRSPSVCSNATSRFRMILPKPIRQLNANWRLRMKWRTINRATCSRILSLSFSSAYNGSTL
jgi:beta-lactamase regulating signal transducer with metallopeptidase domain